MRSYRNYLSPGVYRAPQTSTDADPRLVRTDIAGFVGYAERGPVAPFNSSTLPDPSTLAVRLTSWSQFRSIFGGVTPTALMPYAVRAFFENGGKVCYVARVAASSVSTAADAPRAASFRLPTGYNSVPITTISKAMASSSTLTVASTNNLISGDVIGVGPSATNLTLRTIQAVVGAQNITLNSALTGDVGSGVWLMSGTVLTSAGIAGQTDITVASSAAFQLGDTVTVMSDGIQETASIDGILGPNTIVLTPKLKGQYPIGAFVCRQKTGLSFTAVSAGNWGNRLRVGLTPRLPVPPNTRFNSFDLDFTLLPGSDLTQPAEAERFLNLSLDETSSRYAPNIVNNGTTGSNLVRLNIPASFDELIVNDGRVAPFPISLSGGRDGLRATTARDFIGADGDFRGLRVLEEIDEIGILVAPDAVNPGQPAPPSTPKPAPDPCAPVAESAPPSPLLDDPTARPPNSLAVFGSAVFQAMVDQARRLRYRVAILDPPDNLEPTDVFNKWLKLLAFPAAYMQFAAVYYPWLMAPDGLTKETGVRRVPPGGHIAGAYAQVDNSVGVQHPPANVKLQFVVSVCKRVSDSQQGMLNDLGINLIRAFPGRGIRVWGARSVAAGDDAQPQWWYIHVRRTMSMIEDSVEKSMQWTVFEPNTDILRRTLTHSLNVLLEQIWQAGALKGTSTSEAYFVKCDANNNPQSLIDAGSLVCEVGVAVAAPMEFLTFQVRRLPDGSGVVEA
ncbi:MAG TPA: phage tail sheath C-terminal domain-containing protein [Gemmataceae bacterium]|nr:phage tail sheath C-terminal domain-containing protein [Gemmataceae bacterium]